MAVVDEMERQIHIGPRVRALRDAMDLSLRDLSDRCGVSAPMLSQVERGETSPTLAVAERIAAGVAPPPPPLPRARGGGGGGDRPGPPRAGPGGGPGPP